MRACCSERLGSGRTDPARCTGDECNLALSVFESVMDAASSG